MKKLFYSFIFAFTLFLSLAVADRAEASVLGTRENPFNAYEKTEFTFKPYFTSNEKQVELQLLELTTGDTANQIVQQEYNYNDKPQSDEQWLLFKYNLKHIKNSKDEQLAARDVIYNNQFSSDFYFSKNYRGIQPISTATFYGNLKENEVRNVLLYPGAQSNVYAGALMKKSDGYPLFRIRKSDGTYYWFTTDPKAFSVRSNAKSSYVYTGKAIQPSIIVKTPKETLKQNVDYTVTYKNNKNVGKATVTVKGKGQYEGVTRSFTFNIKPKSPTITTASNSSKYTITLKWKKVTGAKKYEIYYSYGGLNYYKYYTTTSTSKKINYVSRGYTYKIKVRAVYNSDIYTDSQIKAVKVTK
ncbi:hypothetical protein [Rummeliibacillus pycnus]|uniref:hypothetical protein n=1 Tax=Rummeliibacillus pycnus TaxID=101070 RepID=UPI003D29E08D